MELTGALHKSPLIEASRERALFRLDTVGRFLVRLGEPTVVQAAPGATDEDVQCLLGGPVAALRACLAGEFSLRGAAAEVGGRSLAVLGTASGTSSLVAGLALRGQRVVADSVVCVTGEPPHVSPVRETTPGRVTLWPDSVEALGLDPAAGERVRPGIASRSFAFGPPDPLSVPLGALVVLAIDYRLGSPGEIVVRRAMRPDAAVMRLLAGQWHHQLARDLGMRKEQFEWAASLVAAAPPVRLYRAPGQIASTLPAVLEAAQGVLS